MKRKLLIILSIIFAIIALVVILIIIKLKSYSIMIGDLSSNDTINIVYKIDDDTTIYSTFDDIKIRKWGKEYMLKEAFEKNKISILELILQSNERISFNDGGSWELKYKKGSFTNTDFVIMICNAKHIEYNNKNIYFIKEYDIENGVCHRNENEYKKEN